MSFLEKNYCIFSFGTLLNVILNIDFLNDCIMKTNFHLLSFIKRWWWGTGPMRGGNRSQVASVGLPVGDLRPLRETDR